MLSVENASEKMASYKCKSNSDNVVQMGGPELVRKFDPRSVRVAEEKSVDEEEG